MTLTDGARKLLDLFRWFWREGADACFPKLPYLARKFAVTARTIRRWTAELAAAGWLRKPRGGRGRGCRYLPVDKPVQEKQGWLFLPKDVRSGCPVREAVSFNELPENKLQNLAEAETLPVEKEKSTPTPEPEAEGFSTTEKQAIARAVEAHCRPDGRAFVCSGGLLRRLERIAIFYGANGFAVAAHLERVRRTDLQSPSRWPNSDSWFCAVLEARLKRREAKPMQREERNGAVFIGWTQEELAAALAEEAILTLQKPVAQSEAVKPAMTCTLPTVKLQGTAQQATEEYLDTRELVRGIASGKRWPGAA